MKRFNILEEKLIIASAASFIGSLYFPWTPLHIVTGGALAYSIIAKADIIDYSLTSETQHRKLRLSE